MKVFTVLLGCSLLTVAVATKAQTAESGTPLPTAVGRPVSEAIEQKPAASANLADIVVTANRREERLQEVPVSVTVIDGNQLTRQNVNAVENLVRTAPTLNLAGPSGFGALSIRGIGSLSFSRTSEGSVGVVVDGVALANTSINPPLLFDIERVEVLEGPQSTLFGRNASAGIINIVTKAPDPTKQEGVAHLDVGSRNNYVARLAANVPLGTNAALRIAASFSQDPQVQYNRFDDSHVMREAKSVRGRFLWKPTDTLTFNLSGDYTQTNVDGGTPWAVYSSSATSLLTARLRACGVTISRDNDIGCVGGGNSSTLKTYGGSGQVDLDLGGITLTSISAYRRALNPSANDVDSTTANRLNQVITDRARNFSQELRLSTPSNDTVEGIAGLYYFNGKTANTTQQSGQLLADLPLIGACPLRPVILCSLIVGQTRPTDTRTESYAAFGQATVHLKPALRLVLGARVGHEDVQAVATASTVAPGAIAAFAPLPAINAGAKDTYLSYRAGLQYDVSRNLMVYATYTRGYKGPAVNDQGAGTAGIPLLVRSEIPKAGEIGFKSTLAGGRAAFNATAFYTKVDNFQTQFINIDTGVPLFVFGNAPAFTSKGVSANVFGRPIEGLTVNLGGAFVVTRYGKGYLQPNATGTIVDVSVDQPGGRFKGTSSIEYVTALGNSANGFIQADLVYSPQRYANAARDAVLSTPGAAILGGRIGLRTSDQLYGISVFGRNLFDTYRPTSRFATPIAGQQLDPASFSQFAGPESHRVIGLSLDARF